MSRIARTLLMVLAAAGCSDRDVTAPASADAVSANRLDADRSSHDSRAVEIGYTKWLLPAAPGTAIPMVGNTTRGDGTFTGTLFRRTPVDGGTQLTAEYVVADPSGGDQAFTALVDGRLDNATQLAALDGIVTSGWRRGARVHAEFQRFAPCVSVAVPVCFTGTIRVSGLDRRRNAEHQRPAGDRGE